MNGIELKFVAVPDVIGPDEYGWKIVVDEDRYHEMMECLKNATMIMYGLREKHIKKRDWDKVETAMRIMDGLSLAESLLDYAGRAARRTEEKLNCKASD